MIEIEIKFQLEENNIDKIIKELLSRGILKQRDIGSAKTKEYETVYLDTQRDYFQKNKNTLRFRRELNDGFATLDFKGDILVGEGLFKRIEISRKLKSATLEELEGEEVLKLFAESFENQKKGMNIEEEIVKNDLAQGDIKILFSIYMRRKIFFIDIGESKVQLSIDLCKLNRKEKTLEFVELEAELERGREEDLLNLRREISLIEGVEEVTKSKFQRGLELLN